MLGVIHLGLKRGGRKTDLLPLFKADMNSEWTCTYSSTRVFLKWPLIKHMDYFTFASTKPISGACLSYFGHILMYGVKNPVQKFSQYEDLRGSGCIDPSFIHLDSSWR
jgi:hypothetical protein